MVKNNKFLSLYIIIILSSCTLDYKKSRVAEILSEKIPDKIFFNFEYRKAEGDNAKITLKANKAEIFSKKKETYLTNVEFREYDIKGEIVTEGTAEKALIFLENDSIELQGNLKLYSSKNESTINSDYIFWDSDKKEIRGKEDSYVKIIKDSGSSIEGKGFKADTRLLSISFKSEVKGTHVSQK